MNTGLLPIGSVVLLRNSKKRVMIMGVCQRAADEIEKIYDYSGVMFPEGYLGGDKVFLFNNEQIQTVFALGYQDAEQMAFKAKADETIIKLRST